MNINRYCQLACLTLLAFAILLPAVQADETCMSPYMAKIVGQEDYVYVWTLGAPGVGDEQDKLVVIDVNPKSPDYKKVVHTVSVGGRNEAHHSGLTDDRRYLWASGLDTSKIFIKLGRQAPLLYFLTARQLGQEAGRQRR